VRQPALIPILHDGAEKYQLLCDWTFHWKGNAYVIPGGLVVDGASVPRLLWPFMPPDGLHRAASLAHDYLYILRGRMFYGHKFSKAESDLVFYGLLREAGLNDRRAYTAYAAVKWFGWKAWLSEEDPIILPLQSSAPLSHVQKNRLTRHLYATVAPS
jgi:hypothetical protein